MSIKNERNISSSRKYNNLERTSTKNPILRLILEERPLACLGLPGLISLLTGARARANPVWLGLSKTDDQEHAYIQCLDPGAPYTNSGIITFRIARIDRKEDSD